MPRSLRELAWLPILCCISLKAAAVTEILYIFDGNLADTSGNGGTGVLYDNNGNIISPAYSSGDSGQALALNGSSYMAFEDSLFESLSKFTIRVRFKVSDSTHGVIFGYQDNVASTLVGSHSSS